jgi:hypothetical protein
MAGTASAAQVQQQARRVNMAARQAIVRNALLRWQQIANISVGGGAAITAQNNQITIYPQPVGLVTKFIVKISGTFTNTDGSNAAAITNFGLANVLNQVIFNDLMNNTRINTTGWHISFLNSVRLRRVFAASMALTAPANQAAAMGSYGANWSSAAGDAVIYGRTALTVSGGANPTTSFNVIYEIPISYATDDLRGAIFMQVVNATANLQLFLNPNVSTAAAADPTLAIYSGTTGVTMSGVQVQVYQEYWDQLPQSTGGPVLPGIDTSTIYGMIYSPFASGLAANQQFPIPYANFRDFLSTMIVYDNWTTGGGGSYPVPGSDIVNFSLQSANFTNIWQEDPFYAAYRVRKILGDDMPVPVYYFGHRNRPISTVQTGNMQLIIQPGATVNSGAMVLEGLEYFTTINTITGAASIAGN